MANSRWRRLDTLPGLLLVIFALLFSGSLWLRTLEWRAYAYASAFLPPRQADNSIVIVGIDEPALAPSAWPVSRTQLAHVVEQIGRAQASVIGILLPLHEPENAQAVDVLQDMLAQPETLSTAESSLLKHALSRLQGDDALVEHLRRYNTVLGLTYEPDYKPAAETTVLPFDGHTFKAPMQDHPFLTADGKRIYARHILLPSAPILHAFRYGGLQAALPNPDGGIAAPPLLLAQQTHWLPSFELQVVAASQGFATATLSEEQRLQIGNWVVNHDQSYRSYPYYYPEINAQAPFTMIPFADVWQGHVKKSMFRNKIVLLGQTPGNIHLPPVVASAHLISNITQQHDIRLNPFASLWRIAAFILIGAYFLWILPRLSHVSSLALTTLLLAGGAVLQLLLLVLAGEWLPLTTPLVVLLLGYLLHSGAKYFQQQLDMYQQQLSDTQVLLGQAYHGQGQLDAAFACYQKCQPQAELCTHLYNLGLDYERKRQFNKAIKVFQHIRSYAPAYKDIQQHIEQNAQHDKVNALSGGHTQTPGGTLLLTDRVEKPMLGRYQIEKVLGSGAMGTVYLGRDPKINRTVAIKTMAVSGDDEKNLNEFRKRFYREAETAGRLNHPHIVTVYDVGEEHDLAYIAMDYLQGASLSDYCTAKKRLPLKELLDIAAQVAEGLHYAHENKVVHRDIKPANIIYDRDKQQCVITDFGVAHIIDMSHTATGTVLGTPYFMSPEQLSGKKLDGRSDIFSLGISLYQLLSGELPFQGESLAALMYNIANKRHPDINSKCHDLPPCIKTIVNRCLQKDPEKRYADAAQLTKALRNCRKQL